ncbi:MAG TPA: DUF4351 domain-containing protein [Blastocatellia bacterium]|nr:DUF4351 domain-containing protein [Blastocatellia bacterium]
MDSYLRLDPEEDRKYKAELEKLAPEEKEKIMEVAMSWWEQAEQKGLEQGLEQGIQGKQRMLSLLMRQIEKRLGPIDAKLQARISGLNLDQIESLGEAVLDFERPDDLKSWLERA